MGLTENIILWTISLLLSVVGITFGIIASWNSSKANRSIKELIEASWVAEEAEKFFFNNMKTAKAANAKTISKLREKEGKLKYSQYSMLSSNTRFFPINRRAQQILKESEYGELLKMFLSSKTELDLKFSNVFKQSFDILRTTAKIDDDLKKELLDYHKTISKAISLIIYEYTNILARQ